MTDAFALLGEPRRPWIHPDTLRARFHEVANPVHPDRFHSASQEERDAATARYAELNAAHQTLREPRLRLAHLLELETGAPLRDIQRLPPGVMDLFVEVGQGCRDVDEFLVRKNAATSPMLKLGAVREIPAWFDRLNGLQARVAARQAELDRELEALNPAWASAPPLGDPSRAVSLPLEDLERLYRACSYAGRWSSQLQERIAQLIG